MASPDPLHTPEPVVSSAPAHAPSRDTRLLASTILGVAWGTFPGLAGLYIIYDLEAIAKFLQSDPEHGFWGFVAVFALSAGLGLLPTYAQAFLGGWVFGLKWGLAGSILGFSGGAAIGYLFARLVSGRSVDHWIDRHPRGRVIRDALVRGSTLRTFTIVTLLRLPPASPFALTNFALGATRVPFTLMLFATPLGMLPRTSIVCFLAASAVASGATDIVSVYDTTPRVVFIGGIVATILVFVGIGKFAERALQKMTTT